MKPKRWIIAQEQVGMNYTTQNYATLADFVAAVRGLKGIFNKDSATKLLLHDPMLLNGMHSAVSLIQKAISQDLFICVFGDYDCDGIAATAMVVDYFQNVGVRVCYYIPNRIREGYGLNIDAINELHHLGVGLIITVDNGISAYDEVERAIALGMDVIITDHHTPQERIPRAHAVINPHLSDSGYPFKNLSGVGVAFKLLSALEGDNGDALLDHYSDLLAIGTVADVVDLTDENRIFVLAGLALMQSESRIGLLSLMRSAGLSASKLTSENIAFVLAPRLNAAGRLDTAELSVMLLLSQDQTESDELAERLESLNTKRKELETKVYNDIEIMLRENPILSLSRVLILSKDDWEEGVLGIACARLAERFEKPTILFSTKHVVAKGSGRSIEGFSLIDAVSSCNAHLLQFGGHPMAAGMSISRENISAFSVAINNYAQTFHPIMPIPALTIDGIIDPSVLTLEQAQSLDFLKPFGSGNQQPVFAVLSTVVTGITDLSAGKHTKIKFIKNNIPFEGLIFFENKNQLFFDAGDSIDIAFALTWNTFRDKPNITVKILDIHPPKLDVRAFYVSKQTYERCRNGCQVSCNPLPNRIEVAALYRFLSKNKGMINDFDVIYFRMVREGDVDYVRMRIAFDALLELGLICVADSYCGKVIQPNPSAKKTALENSSILRSLTATL